MIDLGSFVAVLNFNSLLFVYSSYIAIIVGGITVIISFCGCVGAWKESRCLLVTVRVMHVLVNKLASWYPWFARRFLWLCTVTKRFNSSCEMCCLKLVRISSSSMPIARILLFAYSITFYTVLAASCCSLLSCHVTVFDFCILFGFILLSV